MAENDKIETAGILSKMRQSAGLVNLQDLFDGLRESQKILGRKVLKLIQLNFTPEKVELITKKKPTDEFFSKVFAKYDIAVEEGLLTDTQQQSEFIQLTALKAMGVQVTDEELIDSSSLHDKKKIKERIAAQSQQAQQVEQVQTQMAMQQQAVLTESLNAKAESDKAMAVERIAKIQQDQAINVERLSRSEEDRTAGVLNLIKAVKELEDMDLESLLKKLNFLRDLENDQKASEETKKQELQSQIEQKQSSTQTSPAQTQENSQPPPNIVQ
jgi:hypothetical protein